MTTRDDERWRPGLRQPPGGGRRKPSPEKRRSRQRKTLRETMLLVPRRVRVGPHDGEQLGEQTERKTRELTDWDRRGYRARALSRPPSFGLGAGRSQVQILSPRLVEEAMQARSPS